MAFSYNNETNATTGFVVQPETGKLLIDAYTATGLLTPPTYSGNVIGLQTSSFTNNAETNASSTFNYNTET